MFRDRSCTVAAQEATSADRVQGKLPINRLSGQRKRGEAAMSDTILDGSGEQIPGQRLLAGTDLEIAYTLLGDDLVLRVNKAGVQVFGVVLEDAAKTLTPQKLLELKSEKADLVVRIGSRGDAVAGLGYRLGRVAGKLMKAARDAKGSL
jgi:hypothetical protein